MEHLRERTRPRGVGIRSIGRYLPDRVVSNADLERILLTRDDWIRENIGVRTRRMAADDQWTSDLGAAALLDACARAGVRPSEVDLVVCGTYTPDHMAPPTAMLVIDKSGAVGAAGFDVNSGACPGGVFALDVGAKYLASGQYRRVAVVLADVSTRTMDWKDPGPAVIFGDGAACYLLEPCAPGLGIGTTLLRSDPSAYQAVRVAREQRTRRDGTRLSSGFGDNFSTLDGSAVHGLAVGEVPPFVAELLAAAGREVEDIDLFALHQANLYIVREIMAAIGVPMDRTVVNIEKYGNTSGASVPLVLREAEDTGRLSPGDQVVLAAFGSGFSMGAALVRWCGPEDFTPEEFAREEFAPEKVATENFAPEDLAPEEFAPTGIRS